MTRHLRIRYEGAHYHIFAKGNKGENIFRHDDDKVYFLRLISDGYEKYEVEIYAYCILSNHYHLLIQTKKANLSEFMHYLGSSYATHLSKDGWKGHVFWGRYNSICVDREEYLMILSRYIHLNPVAANMARLPEEYPWSSYVYYTDGIQSPSWLNTEWIVDYFGPGLELASSKYQEFVMTGVDEEIVYPSEHVIGHAILGSKEFADRIIRIMDEESVCAELMHRKGTMKGLSIERLNEAVQELYGMQALLKCNADAKGQFQKARMVFIYLAKKYTESTNKEIAEIIGGYEPGSVSSRYAKICRKSREDEHCRDELLEETSKVFHWLEREKSKGSNFGYG